MGRDGDLLGSNPIGKGTNWRASIWGGMRDSGKGGGRAVISDGQGGGGVRLWGRGSRALGQRGYRTCNTVVAW